MLYPSSQKNEDGGKLKEILLLIFWLRPVLWSCFGLFMSAEAPCFPSHLSFMALFGTICEKEELLGFSRKWALASIFPAQHEKAHITKDLHICQRFGAEGKEEGKKRQEKGALLHFKSSNSKLGFFGINSFSSSSKSRRVLTAFHRRPLFRSALGYHIRQEGEWKEMQAIVGSEAWMWWLGNFTGL